MAWNIIHFVGLAMSFVGGLLLALFCSDFKITGRKVFARTGYARAAFASFAIGFLLIVWWAWHMLVGE